MAQQVLVNVYGLVNNGTDTPTARTFPSQGITCKAPTGITLSGSTVRVYGILQVNPTGSMMTAREYYIKETPAQLATIANA